MSPRADEIRDGFSHLHASDPVLAGLIDKRPDYDPDAWLEEMPVVDLFGALLLQICGQQISIAAARAIFGRLRDLAGGKVPTPDQVSSFELQALRDIGLSWRKAATMRELGARFADGTLTEGRLSELTDEQVVAELTEVKGIGRWTVHGALIVALRRNDVVPVGDLMLRGAVQRYYGLADLPSEREVGEIAEAWHPFGSLGTNLLFAALELDEPSS